MQQHAIGEKMYVLSVKAPNRKNAPAKMYKIDLISFLSIATYFLYILVRPILLIQRNI